MTRICGYFSLKSQESLEQHLDAMVHNFGSPFQPGERLVGKSLMDASFGFAMVEPKACGEEDSQASIHECPDDAVICLGSSPLRPIPAPATGPVGSSGLTGAFGANHADPVQMLVSTSGAIASAVVDRARSSLVLMRDRFGARTLYFLLSEDHQTIYFSSEIKALLAVIPSARLNTNIALRFLCSNYRMVFGRGETFFSDIQEIPLGSAVSFSAEGLVVSRYWTPPNSEFPAAMSEESYQARFQSFLEQSVREALTQAKRPLFLVSGGLDAPAIAALAAYSSDEPIHCISAIFPDHPEIDESKYVDELIAHLDAEFTPYEITQVDFLERFWRLQSRHDQPLLSPVYVLTHAILEYASANGYDSVFGGGGGDLVTMGCLEYQPYVLADYLGTDAYWDQLVSWETVVGPSLRYWPATAASMDALIRNLVVVGDPGNIQHNSDWIVPDRRFLSKDQLSADILPPEIPLKYSTYRQSRIADEYLHQAVATHFVEELNSAEFQLLTMDPFWSQDLVEFSFQAPLKLVTDRGYTKVTTRTIMKGKIPESIRLRPDKVGLAMPMASWLRHGPVRDAFASALEDLSDCAARILDRDAVLLAFEAHCRRESDEAWSLWRVFSFAAWAKRWID